MLDNSRGSRKGGKRVLEILKGPKTLLGSKTLFPLTLVKRSRKSQILNLRKMVKKSEYLRITIKIIFGKNRVRGKRVLDPKRV